MLFYKDYLGTLEKRKKLTLSKIYDSLLMWLFTNNTLKEMFTNYNVQHHLQSRDSSVSYEKLSKWVGILKISEKYRKCAQVY